MKFFSVFFILLSLSAQAEYRVFKLQISTVDSNQTREVLSTLDPDQYPGYYPLKAGEYVSYTETWMCKGRTNEMPICPNPKAASSQEAAETIPNLPPPTS